jgi:choice-of-anchor A domain-containing protein
MQVLRDYHVVSLRDFTAIGGSDVEGRVAVLGNVNISHYSVSFVVAPPTPHLDGAGQPATDRNDLVACGKLTFLSGAVMGGGNALYVDPGSTIHQPLASVYPPGRFVHAAACPLYHDDVELLLWQMAGGLASLPRTGTAVIEYT